MATEKREADLLQKESIEVMRVLDSQACKRERGGGLGDTGLKGGGKQEFPHTHTTVGKGYLGVPATGGREVKP